VALADAKMAGLTSADEHMVEALDHFMAQTGLQFSVMRLPGDMLLLCAGTMASVH
jgi:hypothetical protein